MTGHSPDRAPDPSMPPVRVVSVRGDHVVLDGGGQAGIRLGDRLRVHRLLNVVADPDDPTREMDRITVTIGEVLVTGVDQVAAMGRFEGHQPVEPGDLISVAAIAG